MAITPQAVGGLDTGVSEMRTAPNVYADHFDHKTRAVRAPERDGHALVSKHQHIAPSTLQVLVSAQPTCLVSPLPDDGDDVFSKHVPESRGALAAASFACSARQHTAQLCMVTSTAKTAQHAL